MPSAIAWREAVGMLPTQLVDALLQGYLHLVGTLLGNDTTQGIGNEHTHHIALLFQALLIGLILHPCGTDKQGISL